MLKKAISALMRFSLNRELGMALQILSATRSLLSSFDEQDLIRLVYVQLPEQWKFPNGPATEMEFQEAIQAGKVFLIKVKALTRQ